MALFTFAESTYTETIKLSDGSSTKYSQKNATQPHESIWVFTLILELIPHQPQMSVLKPVVFTEWDCKADGRLQTTEVLLIG